MVQIHPPQYVSSTKQSISKRVAIAALFIFYGMCANCEKTSGFIRARIVLFVQHMLEFGQRTVDRLRQERVRLKLPEELLLEHLAMDREVVIARAPVPVLRTAVAGVFAAASADQDQVGAALHTFQVAAQDIATRLASLRSPKTGLSPLSLKPPVRGPARVRRPVGNVSVPIRHTNALLSCAALASVEIAIVRSAASFSRR